MPTRDELANALRQADAAGNADDARRLAAAIKAMDGQQPAAPTPVAKAPPASMAPVAKAPPMASNGAGMGSVNPMVAMGQRAQAQLPAGYARPEAINQTNPIVAAQRAGLPQANEEWLRQREAEKRYNDELAAMNAASPIPFKNTGPDGPLELNQERPDLLGTRAFGQAVNANIGAVNSGIDMAGKMGVAYGAGLDPSVQGALAGMEYYRGEGDAPERLATAVQQSGAAQQMQQLNERGDVVPRIPIPEAKTAGEVGADIVGTLAGYIAGPGKGINSTARGVSKEVGAVPGLSRTVRGVGGEAVENAAHAYAFGSSVAPEGVDRNTAGLQVATDPLSYIGIEALRTIPRGFKAATDLLTPAAVPTNAGGANLAPAAVPPPPATAIPPTRPAPPPIQPQPAAQAAPQPPAPVQTATAPPVPPQPPVGGPPVAAGAAGNPPGVPVAQAAQTPPPGTLTPVTLGPAEQAVNAMDRKARESLWRAFQNSGVDRQQAEAMIRSLNDLPPGQNSMYEFELVRRFGADFPRLKANLQAMGRDWAITIPKDPRKGAPNQVMDDNVGTQIKSEGEFIDSTAQNLFGQPATDTLAALETTRRDLSGRYNSLLDPANPYGPNVNRMRGARKAAHIQKINGALEDLTQYLQRPEIMAEVPEWVRSRVMLDIAKDMRERGGDFIELIRKSELAAAQGEASIIQGRIRAAEEAGDMAARQTAQQELDALAQRPSIANLVQSGRPLRYSPELWKTLTTLYPTQVGHTLQSAYGRAIREGLSSGDVVARTAAEELIRLRGGSKVRANALNPDKRGFGLLHYIEEAVPGYRDVRKQYGDIMGAEEAVYLPESFFRIANNDVALDEWIKAKNDLSPAQQAALESGMTTQIQQALRKKHETLSPEELDQVDALSTPNLTRLSEQPVLNALEKAFGAKGKQMADAIRAASTRTDRVRSIHPNFGPRTRVNDEAVKNAKNIYGDPLGGERNVIDNITGSLAAAGGASAFTPAGAVAAPLLLTAASARGLYNLWKRGKQLSGQETEQLADFFFRSRRPDLAEQIRGPRGPSVGDYAGAMARDAAIGAGVGAGAATATGQDPMQGAVAGGIGGAAFGARRAGVRNAKSLIKPPPAGPRGGNRLRPGGNPPPAVGPRGARTLPGQTSPASATVTGALVGGGVGYVGSDGDPTATLASAVGGGAAFGGAARLAKGKPRPAGNALKSGPAKAPPANVTALPKSGKANSSDLQKALQAYIEKPRTKWDDALEQGKINRAEYDWYSGGGTAEELQKTKANMLETLKTVDDYPADKVWEVYSKDPAAKMALELLAADGNQRAMAIRYEAERMRAIPRQTKRMWAIMGEPQVSVAPLADLAGSIGDDVAIETAKSFARMSEQPFLVARAKTITTADEAYALLRDAHKLINGKDGRPAWAERLIRDARNNEGKFTPPKAKPTPKADVVQFGAAQKAPPASPPVKPSGAPKPPPVQNGFIAGGGSRLDASPNVGQSGGMGPNGQKYIDDSVEHFGLTDDIREAGYILPDGRMLDLSGRHDMLGGDYVRTDGKNVATGRDWQAGVRHTDHRELPFEVTEAKANVQNFGNESTAHMLGFQKETGAIRVMPGTGIFVAVMPSDRQIKALVTKWRRTYGDEPMLVDVDDAVTGKNISSIDVPRVTVDDVKQALQQAPKSPTAPALKSGGGSIQSGFGNKATYASAGGGIAYGELGPLEDLNNDGVKDEKDRAAMRMKYGMGGIMTPLLVRGGVGMAKSLGNKLRGVKAPPKPMARGVEQGTFAGVNAKTADRAALARAQQMEASGADRNAIWDETGWFKGVDGKWRFEIDDSKAGFNAATRKEFEAKGAARVGKGPDGVYLKTAFNHSEAKNAYPEYEWTGIKGEIRPKAATRGAYRDSPYGEGSMAGRRIDFRAPNLEEGRSVVLHEGQHGIQSSENFARGGSPEQQMAAMKGQRQGDVQPIHDEMRTVLSNTDRTTYDAWNEFVLARVNGDVGRIDQLENMLASSDDGKRLLELDWKARSIGSGSVAPDEGFDAYRRLAGEVEARNVQTRRDFTPEERRAKRPWETQDVPDDQQIVRFGGGKAESRKPPPAQAGFGGGNGPKAPPAKKPPGYGKVRIAPGVEVLPPDRNALKPNPRKAGKAYPMPPSESAELIAARKELRDAKAANTRARNRFVMRENREQLWAEADAREARAMDNVNRLLEEQAAKRQKSGRARDAYHATKDFVYSERGGLLAGAAGAAGTVGLVGLGAALMGGGGEKKKPKGVLAPTDPSYFITNLKGNKDNLAAVQGALVDTGLLADGDDDGNWGKRTSDAIDAWLSRQPDRNPNLPLQDYEVPALLAEAYGGYQDADGKWYYDDGQPIRFPVPNTRGDMADRTLTPTEVRRMRYEERIRKQKAAAQ